MTDSDLTRMLSNPSLADVPILVRELRDCWAKLTTTWVRCDGCRNSYRSRELCDGLCITCWRTLAEYGDKIKRQPTAEAKP